MHACAVHLQRCSECLATLGPAVSASLAAALDFGSDFRPFAFRKHNSDLTSGVTVHIAGQSWFLARNVTICHMRSKPLGALSLHPAQSSGCLQTSMLRQIQFVRIAFHSFMVPTLLQAAFPCIGC